MIFTFYSFKGGVGRSMAMASIGELLFKRRLRVRMVDFDLEAPGLERYFDHKDVITSLAKMRENRGVIDMLEAYSQLTALPSDGTQRQRHDDDVNDDDRIDELLTEPLARFLVPIYQGPAGSYLSILPAGRRADGQFKDYATRVLSFDWNAFFDRLDGELFFEWFRREIVKDCDVVLIDSRTGVTEMTGVTTFHLADVVVSIVAPNHQNLEGLVQIAKGLKSQAVLKARKNRPVQQMFVPSRVALDDETQLNQFKASYESQLGPFVPKTLNFDGDTFHALKILHVPTFSYTERVAGREPGSSVENELLRAYEAIARQMSRLEKPGEPLYASFHSQAEVRAHRSGRLFESLGAEEQRLLQQLATRLVRVGAEGERTVTRNVTLSSTDAAPLEGVLRRAVEQEILREDRTEAGVRIAWVDGNTLDYWSDLQSWISSDRPFLVWRQSLDERLDIWQSDQREGNLLIGAPLTHGSTYLEQRGGELTSSERAFISASIEAEQRRQAADPAARVRTLEASRLDLDSYITTQYTAANADVNRAAIWAAIVFCGLLLAWLLVVDPTVANARARAGSAPTIAAAQKARAKLERIEAAASAKPSQLSPRQQRRVPSARKLRRMIEWMQTTEREHAFVRIGKFEFTPPAAVALTTGFGSLFFYGLILLLSTLRDSLVRTLQPVHDRLREATTGDNDLLTQKWQRLLQHVTDPLGRPLFEQTHRVLAWAALAVVLVILFRVSILAFPLWSYSWPYRLLLVWIGLMAMSGFGFFVMYVRSGLPAQRQLAPLAS